MSPIGTAAVRRHHTVSSSSGRPPRASSRMPISEEQNAWQHGDEDELVPDDDEDWPVGAGTIGDKSNLHRQASLPARYNRGAIWSCSSARLVTSPVQRSATRRPRRRLAR